MAAMTAPDPGLYGPDSEAWRLNREAMLLLGAGPRALLLQIAHPAVAAGVNDHSDFRTDPWRRLAGTLRSYLTIVYGSTAAARAEIRRLNTLHRGITGPGYAARDPELSLWVHATLVDSTMAVADAWLEPLSQDRRADLLRRDAADRAGVRRAGCAAAAGCRGIRPVRGGHAGPRRARSASHRSPASWPRVILRPPLAPLAPLLPLPTAAARAALGRVPAATYAWTLWPSVGLLPPSVRDDYGLAWGPRERLVSAWLVAGFRAWRPLLPASFRQMPKALAADRRMSEGAS